MTERITYLLAQARHDGCGKIHPNRDYLNSFYCWGNFDGAVVVLEISPDGEEWFVAQRFAVKDFANMSLGTGYLRGRIEHAGERTKLNLLVI